MKVSRHWIFDGYNVMYALHFFDNSNLSSDTVREKFISYLLPFRLNNLITVVFDNNINQSNCKFDTYFGIKIIFNKIEYNADYEILKLIKRTKNELRKNLVIVTGDLALRDIVLEYNCEVISPEEFFNEFKNYNNQNNYAQLLNSAIKNNPFEKFFKNKN